MKTPRQRGGILYVAAAGLAVGYILSQSQVTARAPEGIIALIAMGVCIVAALRWVARSSRIRSAFRPRSRLDVVVAVMALTVGWTAGMPASRLMAHHADLRSTPAQPVLLSGSLALRGSTGILHTRGNGSYRLRFPPGLAHDRLHPGDEVMVLGVAIPPSPPRNPGGFDEPRWMVQSGLSASIVVERIRIEHHHKGADSWRKWARQSVQQRIDSLFPDEAVRALVAAMILGDRSRLAPDLEDAFRSAGLMHLLAVSGLHFGSIVLLLWLVVGLVVRRWAGPARMQLVLLSGLVWVSAALYGHLVGWSPSVLRSFLMLSLALLCRLGGQSGWLERSLLLSAVIILVMRPLLWRSMGTQLSFAAVTGIALGLRMVHSGPLAGVLASGSIMAKTMQSVLISAAAFLGTLPVLLWHVGWVPLMALVLSPPAILLTTVTLILAVVSLLLPVVGGAVALVCTQGFRVLIGMSEGVHGGVYPILRATDGADIAAAVALSLCLVVSSASWRRYMRAMIVLGLMAAASFLWLRTEGASLIMLDVGQGDALIMHAGDAPGHRDDPLPSTFVIDTGPGPSAGRTIAHALGRRGKTKVGLILSHGDSDHVGGLETLVEFVDLVSVVAPWSQRFSDSGFVDTGIAGGGNEATRAALPLGEEPTRRGNLLRFPSGLRGYVLHPRESGQDNDHSLVALVVAGRTGLLLTGDLGARGERWLIHHYGPLFDRLDTRILKVAHHGSVTSSSIEFVERFQPDLALISAGRHNRFGHPDPDVVDRLEGSGAIVLSTQGSGAIRIRRLGGPLSIHSHASGRWRRTDQCSTKTAMRSLSVSCWVVRLMW